MVNRAASIAQAPIKIQSTVTAMSAASVAVSRYSK